MFTFEKQKLVHFFCIFALRHSSSHFNRSYGVLSDLVTDTAREQTSQNELRLQTLCLYFIRSSLCCGAEKPACERRFHSGFELAYTGACRGECVLMCMCVCVCVMVSRRAAERSVFSRGGNRWNGAE